MKNWKTSLRIIWTIALKDIVDAVKSKTTLSIMLGVALTMLSGRALPLLLQLKPVPTAAVYDAGDARLVKALRQRDGIRVYNARSQAEMESRLAEGTDKILGLVIPADFDARLAAGETITLDGYGAHWTDMEEIAALQAVFEAEINDITGETVYINTDTPRLYPTTDTQGQSTMMTMSLVIATTLICVILVPYLMIDEKEKHTIDALLVSPASIGQVVAGKAIAGAFYGLVAGILALAFSHVMVVHWWAALLTVVCGTAFAVAVGLMMGSFFDNAQNMGVWMGAVMLGMLVPVMAEMATRDNWPAILQAVFPQLPTALMSGLFRTSFAQYAPSSLVLGKLALILLWAAPLYALVIWRIRRSDR